MRSLTVLLAVAACSKGSDIAEPVPMQVPERVLGVPNVDFTNQWSREKAGDNDFVPFEIVPGSRQRAYRLTLGSGSRFHRIWLGDELLLDKDNPTFDLAWDPDPIELHVEFGDFNVSTELTVEELDMVNAPVSSAVIELTASPLLLNHHLQPAELLMAVEVNYQGYSNLDMMADYEAILGERFINVPGTQYGGDVWLQDEIELAWGGTPDGRRMDIAIDSIRDRGLDEMPEDLLRGEDFGVLTWGEGTANSFDSFGNLETSPPVDGYPYGRIYYGSVPGAGPVDDKLFDKLAEQGVQDPFTVDTSWLCVGHVDEIMSFIPDSTAPRGFRFIFSDTDLAWELLEAMDPATPLPRYQGPSNHNIASVGEMVDDLGLRQLNSDIQADDLDPILQQMKTELGLLDEEIILIPGLFEEPSYCGRAVAAVIPGMANLVVDIEEGGPTRIFMADPFIRTDLDDQDSDPFITRMRELLPAENELVFLDDWQAYHMALGEVHCGTNVVRTPTVVDY